MLFCHTDLPPPDFLGVSAVVCKNLVGIMPQSFQVDIRDGARLLSTSS
jgi:hypothetical protein